jgi:hypothetical protein
MLRILAERDRLDLHERAARQRRHLHRRTRRRRCREALAVDLVDRREVFQIDEVNRRLDDAIERAACRGEHRAQVLHDPLGLRADIPGADQLAALRIERDLPR